MSHYVEIVLKGDNAPDAGAHGYAGPGGPFIISGEVETAVGHGLRGGGPEELGVAIHTPGFLLVEISLGIEIGDFGGDAHLEVGGIEGRDGPDAGDAALRLLPERVDISANRIDGSQPGNDYAPACHVSRAW